MKLSPAVIALILGTVNSIPSLIVLFGFAFPFVFLSVFPPVFLSGPCVFGCSTWDVLFSGPGIAWLALTAIGLFIGVPLTISAVFKSEKTGKERNIATVALIMHTFASAVYLFALIQLAFSFRVMD